MSDHQFIAQAGSNICICGLPRSAHGVVPGDAMKLAETRAMSTAFRHFYHLDHHNAAVHMSPVRYSPITFRLAECLDTEPRRQDMMYDGDQTYFDVGDVMADRNRYPEDRGRIEADSDTTENP